MPGGFSTDGCFTEVKSGEFAFISKVPNAENSLEVADGSTWEAALSSSGFWIEYVHLGS